MRLWLYFSRVWRRPALQRQKQQAQATQLAEAQQKLIELGALDEKQKEAARIRMLDLQRDLTARRRPR